jgi:acetoin utilization protein AcuB
MNATTTVLDYMTACPHSIGSDQPFARAHEQMRALGVRHLPVLTGGRVVGIVSERDLALVEAMREEIDPERLTVEEAMTPEPYVVEPSAPLAAVAREMAAHRYGAALVVESGRLVGVFTTTDALRALADALG